MVGRENEVEVEGEVEIVVKRGSLIGAAYTCLLYFCFIRLCHCSFPPRSLCVARQLSLYCNIQFLGDGNSVNRTFAVRMAVITLEI